MKPKSKNQRSYNEHDVAVMDLSSEFDEGIIVNDFDYIDLDAKAEVDFNDESDEWY